MTRRAQQPITIRSDRAAARLALLTRDGRSQARVIEEALERMPVPQPADEVAERLARIERTLDRFAAGDVPSMAEFDAREYDDRGNPR
jgi:hypothetical protein